MTKIKIKDNNTQISPKELEKLYEFFEIDKDNLSDPLVKNELYFKTSHVGLSPQFSLSVNPSTIKKFPKLLLHDMDFGPFDRLIRKVRKGAVLSFFKRQKLSDYTILDVGCGRQATLGWNVKDKCKKYYGLDRDVPAIEYKNLSMVVGVAEKIKNKFDNNTFNVITALALIEHIKDPQKFVNDCFDLLCDGGFLVITTPPPYTDPILKFISAVGLINGDEIEEHNIYFSPKTLSQLLINAGFEIVEAKYFAFGLNGFVAGKRPKRKRP